MSPTDSRWRGAAFPLAVPVLLALLASGAFALWRSESSRPLAEMARSVLEAAAIELGDAIAVPAAQAERLAGRISGEPGMGKGAFASASAALMASAPWVTGISIAPDAVIRYHFPESSDSAPLGHDLLTNPRRRDALLDAVKRRVTVVEAPEESVDGATNLFIRVPVFRPAGDFWGFVSVSLDFGALLRDFIPRLGSREMRIAFLASPESIAGSRRLWGDADAAKGIHVEVNVSLPGGSVWVLAASPIGGWGAVLPYPAALLALALAACGILAWLSWSGRLSQTGLSSSQEKLSPASEPDPGQASWAEQAGKIALELKHHLDGLRAETARLKTDTENIPASLPAIRQAPSRFRTAMSPLDALAADLAEYSSACSGKIDPESAPFEIQRLIDDLCARVAPRAMAKGLALRAEAKPGSPRMIEGDLYRLSRIFELVLSESVGRTETGEVTLRVGSCSSPGVRADKASPGTVIMLEFEVGDDGPPVRPDQVESIFAPFNDIRGPHSRLSAVSGAGLSAAKALTDSLGGRILAAKGFGRGLSLAIHIPVRLPLQESVLESFSAPAPKAAPEPVPEPAVPEPASSEEPVGHFATAGDFDGFDDFRSWLKGNPTGLRFKRPAVEGSVFMPSDEEQGTGVVMDYDTDPEPPQPQPQPAAIPATRESRDRIVLVELVEPEPIPAPALTTNAAPLSVPPSVPPSVPAPAPFHLRREPPAVIPSILLVDDGEVNREIMVRMLLSRGYTCDTAEGGDEAVRKCAEKDYDLVFMDCFMPGMDGYAATSRIRAARSAPRPRIVGMSAMMRDSESNRCSDAGMDDVIAKPFTIEELVSKIRLWCSGLPSGR